MISNKKQRLPGIAIVGYGYWGPNLLRTFLNTPGCSVRYVCDLNLSILREIKKRFPSIKTTSEFSEVISDPFIEAVVLAVPTKLHYMLAKQAIEAGKDVLVEKPMTRTLKEAAKLVRLVKKHKRVLMVDHVLLFNPAVIKIQELIDKGEIGQVLYIDSLRANLGRFQKDSNVIFDLAAHEFSIIHFILGTKPLNISASGKSNFGKQIDVAYINALYPQDILVHVHVTWLSPLKLRKMLIVGSKKMIVYDDNESIEKVKVYDKGVIKEKSLEKKGKVEIGYRFGDVWSPHIETADPLTLMAQNFTEAVSTHKITRSDVTFGAEIVEVLENATKLFKIRNRL